MTFQKGSLILINYTATVKDTREVFETTIEDEAKKHNLYDASINYLPKLVSIGDAWVIKGLDDALQNTNAGDTTKIEVSPDKGFGNRDSSKVRMLPLRKLGENADKVSVGDTIEIDNKKCIIRFIGSGRIQVDFNHRFAGKTIVYDVTILKLLETNADKINEILNRHVPLRDSKLTFEQTNEKSINIMIPSKIFRLEGLPIIKHLIKSEIFKFVMSIKIINFIERYTN